MSIPDLVSLKVTVISPVSVGYSLEVTFHFSQVKNLVRRRKGGRTVVGWGKGGRMGRAGRQSGILSNIDHLSASLYLPCASNS